MNLMSILWAIAFGICPQRPSHSLFLGGQQMPIEARMAGMFGGFLIGAAYFVAIGRGRAWRMPSSGMTIVLVVLVALMGIDGVNAFLYDLGVPHLYPPNLYLRLGTGLLTGLTFAGFVVPAFNSTVWQTGLEESPLTSARDVMNVLGLEAAYFVAAISGLSVLLYPVSLIAILGVPILIGLLGAVVITSLLGQSNRAARLADLLPTVLGGLALVVVVLGTFSAVRFALFGPGPLGLPL
jgi:uncharacterized membrane protein